MTDTVAGRVVIVTGASSGIGEATACLLHERGALPVLAARRADRLAVLGKKLDGALAVPTDVTDPAQVHALVKAAIDRHGRVDALVNNAGASYHVRVEEIDPAAYLALLNLNVVSTTVQSGGLIPHSSEYVGRVVLRALRTGEARIDIPHGPEQPNFPDED